MNAWAGPSSTPSTVSLSDVMSEQLAVHLTESDQLKDQNSAHQRNDDLVLRLMIHCYLAFNFIIHH